MASGLLPSPDAILLQPSQTQLLQPWEPLSHPPKVISLLTPWRSRFSPFWYNSRLNWPPEGWLRNGHSLSNAGSDGQFYMPRRRWRHKARIGMSTSSYLLMGYGLSTGQLSARTLNGSGALQILSSLSDFLKNPWLVPTPPLCMARAMGVLILVSLEHHVASPWGLRGSHQKGP